MALIRIVAPTCILTKVDVADDNRDRQGLPNRENLDVSCQMLSVERRECWMEGNHHKNSEVEITNIATWNINIPPTTLSLPP